MVTNLPKNSATPSSSTRVSDRVLWDDSVATWDGISLSLLYDSYSESNRTTDVSLYSSTTNMAGQTFTPSSTGDFNHCKFFLSRTGNPTGTLTAKLYAITGTYGTSSVPTGSALVTSSTLATTLVPTTQALVTFYFPTAYKLVVGTRYAILLDATGVTGDASNLISIGQDTTSPTHGGNKFVSANGGTSYTSSNTVDVCFYVYGGYTFTWDGNNAVSVQTKNSATPTNLTKHTA
jgi:hypothetical protein